MYDDKDGLWFGICLPKVVRLEGIDGAIHHAVTIVGPWVFDSKLPHAQNYQKLFWIGVVVQIPGAFSHVRESLTILKRSMPFEKTKSCKECR